MSVTAVVFAIDDERDNASALGFDGVVWRDPQVVLFGGRDAKFGFANYIHLAFSTPSVHERATIDSAILELEAAITPDPAPADFNLYIAELEQDGVWDDSDETPAAHWVGSSDLDCSWVVTATAGGGISWTAHGGIQVARPFRHELPDEGLALGSVDQVGQYFQWTEADPNTLLDVKWELRRRGVQAGSGAIWVELWSAKVSSITGRHGYEPDVLIATSDTINVAAIGSFPNFLTYEFGNYGSPTLTQNAHYVAILKGDYPIDGSRYIEVRGLANSGGGLQGNLITFGQGRAFSPANYVEDGKLPDDVAGGVTTVLPITGAHSAGDTYTSTELIAQVQSAVNRASFGTDKRIGLWIGELAIDPILQGEIIAFKSLADATPVPKLTISWHLADPLKDFGLDAIRVTDAGLDVLSVSDAGVDTIAVVDAGLNIVPVVDAGVDIVPVVDAGVEVC